MLQLVVQIRGIAKVISILLHVNHGYQLRRDAVIHSFEVLKLLLGTDIRSEIMVKSYKQSILVRQSLTALMFLTTTVWIGRKLKHVGTIYVQRNESHKEEGEQGGVDKTLFIHSVSKKGINMVHIPVTLLLGHPFWVQSITSRYQGYSLRSNTLVSER